MMTIQDKIRYLRQQQKWTQEQTADRLSMSASSYARLENGDTRLNAEKLDKLARLFGVDVADLLDNGNISLSSHQTSDHSQSHHAQTQTDFYHTQNYYYGNEALNVEIDRLKQSVQHQAEALRQKEEMLSQLKQMLHQKDGEIALLKELLALLREGRGEK